MVTHFKFVIVGGGNAGLSVAARLRRAGQTDIAVVEPNDTHYYQPLWTLVGGGRAPQSESVRTQASVTPKGVQWVKGAATGIDPESNLISLDSGSEITYDFLVVCPGIQLNWDKIPGMQAAIDSSFASSNYRFDLAPKTWELIQGLTEGTAIFTMPSGPIKCGGAPQKIAYLAADYWRGKGVLKDIRIILVLPGPSIFGVKVFADELNRVAAGYGIEVRTSSEVTHIDAPGKSVTINNIADGSEEQVGYDMLHVVPPQSAPDWLRNTRLADPTNPGGYVEINPDTMQHSRFPNVFALGDAGSSPNSKTGAAIRKQAPVLVANLLSVASRQGPTAHYDGYSSCPLTTARNKMLLAEFNYKNEPTPSFRFIDTTRARRDMWILKRYGLPFLYWRMILSGRM